MSSQRRVVSCAAISFGVACLAVSAIAVAQVGNPPPALAADTFGGRGGGDPNLVQPMPPVPVPSGQIPPVTSNAVTPHPLPGPDRQLPSSPNSGLSPSTMMSAAPSAAIPPPGAAMYATPGPDGSPPPTEPFSAKEGVKLLKDSTKAGADITEKVVNGLRKNAPNRDAMELAGKEMKTGAKVLGYASTAIDTGTVVVDTWQGDYADAEEKATMMILKKEACAAAVEAGPAFCVALSRTMDRVHELTRDATADFESRVLEEIENIPPDPEYAAFTAALRAKLKQKQADNERMQQVDRDYAAAMRQLDESDRSTPADGGAASSGLSAFLGVLNGAVAMRNGYAQGRASTHNTGSGTINDCGGLARYPDGRCPMSTPIPCPSTSYHCGPVGSQPVLGPR